MISELESKFNWLSNPDNFKDNDPSPPDKASLDLAKKVINLIISENGNEMCEGLGVGVSHAGTVEISFQPDKNKRKYVLCMIDKSIPDIFLYSGKANKTVSLVDIDDESRPRLIANEILFWFKD